MLSVLLAWILIISEHFKTSLCTSFDIGDRSISEQELSSKCVETCRIEDCLDKIDCGT